MAAGNGIEQSVAALGRMTAGQLREKYLDEFGEPTRSGNHESLFERLAWRVQFLAEGTLSKRRLAVGRACRSVVAGYVQRPRNPRAAS